MSQVVRHAMLKLLKALNPNGAAPYVQEWDQIIKEADAELLAERESDSARVPYAVRQAVLPVQNRNSDLPGGWEQTKRAEAVLAPYLATRDRRTSAAALRRAADAFASSSTAMPDCSRYAVETLRELAREEERWQ